MFLMKRFDLFTTVATISEKGLVSNFLGNYWNKFYQDKSVKKSVKQIKTPQEKVAAMLDLLSHY